MIHNKRFFIICLIFSVLVLCASVVVAQVAPPDSDGDGLNDTIDRCPNDAGPRSLNGCPDSDGDGIPDVDDRCPGHPAPGAADGCPPEGDADEDGFPDSIDVCPNDPGPHENAGCPLPADTDGDGIADDQDGCPNVAGYPGTNGCPLPIIPNSGPCAIATAGDVPINVRNLPAVQHGEIIGSLSPLNVYPVNMEIVTGEGSWYHVINNGWVAGWVGRLGGDCVLLPAVQTHSGKLAIGDFLFELLATSTPPPIVTFGDDGTPTTECDDAQQAIFGCDAVPHVYGDNGGLVYFGNDNGIGDIAEVSTGGDNGVGEVSTGGDNGVGELDPDLLAILENFVPPPGMPADSFFDVFFDVEVPVADDGEHGDGAVVTNAFGFLVGSGQPVADDGEHGDTMQAPFHPFDLLGTVGDDGEHGDSDPFDDVFDGLALLGDDPAADDGEHGDKHSHKMGIVIIEMPGGEEGILVVQVGGDGASFDGIDGESTEPDPPWVDVDLLSGLGLFWFDGVDGESLLGLALLDFGGTGFDGVDGEAMSGENESEGALFIFPGSDLMFTPQPEPPGLFIVMDEMLGLVVIAGYDGVDGEALTAYEGVDGEARTGDIYIGAVPDDLGNAKLTLIGLISQILESLGIGIVIGII